MSAPTGVDGPRNFDAASKSGGIVRPTQDVAPVANGDVTRGDQQDSIRCTDNGATEIW